MGRGEIWPPPPKKTITDGHQNLCRWLCRWYLPKCKILSKLVYRFRFCACVISRSWAQSDSAIFFRGGEFLRKATEWAKLDHAVIAAAVRQWRRRPSACVKAGGRHFEHCFQFWHSNSCRLIFRSDFLAVVSHDVVRFNTWRSFNSQGKVVTLIRCGGLLLC